MTVIDVLSLMRARQVVDVAVVHKSTLVGHFGVLHLARIAPLVEKKKQNKKKLIIIHER